MNTKDKKSVELEIIDINNVKDIEGFPDGELEDIIALSDSPFYTLYPNPNIEKFIEDNGIVYDEENDMYQREPFASDVSEGKSDPIYTAHSYHTKVPYKAIMKYILHYTEPGDIVFDGFCGSGMTGVACQMCGSNDEALKYSYIKDTSDYKWGTRKAILSDLSPIASYITKNYNDEVNLLEASMRAEIIIEKCNEKLGWMYKTRHFSEEAQLTIDGSDGFGDIIHVVWSDIFICPNCGEEIVLWDVSMNHEEKKLNELFRCTNCDAELSKKECSHSMNLVFDDILNETINIAKQIPVLIVYTYNGKRYEKKPTKEDLDLIEKIKKYKITRWVPNQRMCLGKESRRNDKVGITHVHQFYTKRNLILLSELRESLYEERLGFEFTALLNRATKQLRVLASNYFHGGGGWVGTGLSGTLYVPSFSVEVNILKTFGNRISRMKKFGNFDKSNTMISCQSATDLSNIPHNSIDYIFTDPPFGSNINYSELSFLWESWLNVCTNNKMEAVVNSTQGKGMIEYQELMTKSFSAYYDVLKPKRWMTIEFSNSKNAVWIAIQEALNRAGFVIADVRVLDKKQGSFKQVNTTTAVKKDLVISAYKPTVRLSRTILKHSGTSETVWDFVRSHLGMLPISVLTNGLLERVRERDANSLFDRMVAYHVVNGIAVPLSNKEFFEGLESRFVKRDGMFFLHDQVNEYEEKRTQHNLEIVQFSLIINDERSAIEWLNYQLSEEQTYADLQPKFVKELKQLKHEKLPELKILLEESFLKNEQGKWYIPDRNKEGDLIKLREKRLLKEFEEYIDGKGKLKLFRTEAIRVGFAKLWKDKDFKSIVNVGNRLPDKVIQEDDKLLMYYDISLSRIE